MIERLLLVRHGETLDNVRGVAQGWNDSALSELGQRQVQAAAQRVAALKPTAIFSSPLPRALTTARAIADATQLEIETIDDLRELNCGTWEGRSFLEVRESESDHYHRWMNDPTVACPGGESFRDLSDRLERAMKHVRARSSAAQSRPVVVSHGMAIRIAATTILDLPLESWRRFAQDNAALNLFEWRIDRFVLKLWNDTTHCEGAR